LAHYTQKKGEGQYNVEVRVPFTVPDREGRAFDIVGFGQNSVDYVAVAATHPSPNSKQQLEQFACLPGGQVATAIVACARLGWRARYIGSFGDDAAGSLSRESLTAEGVDIRAARTVPGATNRLAVILVDARTGERTVLWHHDPALRLDPLDGASREAAASGRLLLVDCEDIAAATAAAMAARQATVPTIVDIEDVRPGTHALLQEIDAIISAEEFPSALTGHTDLGRALEAIEREFRAPLVCVTLGAEGSLARCGGREIRTAPFAVECVDTTGAGDAFRGAFAAGCLRWPKGDIETVLAYANAAAALSCRALGARGGLPSAGEIDGLLERR
jgi:sugar/nucleoside kinase (ribokinase family)